MIDFKVNGIKIGFSIWFLAVLFFLTINKNTETFLFAVFILVHEMGHVLAMYIFDVKPDELNFRFGRIEIVKRNNVITFYKNIGIYSGGIVANLFCIVFLLLFFPNATQAISVNLFLLLFNSIPAGDFDGGNIVSEFVKKQVGSLDKAEGFLNKTNLLFGGCFCVSGVILFFYNKTAIMVFLIGIYLIVKEKFKKNI